MIWAPPSCAHKVLGLAVIPCVRWEHKDFKNKKRR